MSEFLETCKARLAEAQKRFQEAQQKFQAAQQELSVAQQEFIAWQQAVGFETRNQQLASTPPVPAIPTSTSVSSEESSENKTELVRDVLRQHPSGMTPAELSKQLEGKVTRPYLYSVLKRLRDKDEVLVRRKKYCLRVITNKTEEGKQNVLLQ